MVYLVCGVTCGVYVACVCGGMGVCVCVWMCVCVCVDEERLALVSFHRKQTNS